MPQQHKKEVVPESGASLKHMAGLVTGTSHLLAR